MTKRLYPGLRTKFFKLLKGAFDPNEKFPGTIIPDKLREWGSRFDMSEEEINFICEGTGNFLTAAKNAGIIRSNGTKRGYQLIDSSKTTEILEDSVPAPQVTPGPAESFGKMAIWTHAEETQCASILSESFLHLPATFLLAHAFQGQVISLPAKMEGKKWANPDMIMIHDNRLGRPEDNDSDDSGMSWDEQLSLLSKVDNSPQYVITSVELKLALRNRTEVLNALSETALNGGWANQTILVYLEQAESDEHVFHEDALDFARKNGIGIYEIELTSGEASSRSEMRLKCILPAQTRSAIEVKSLSCNRSLFRKVLELIKDYAETGPLLGQLDSTDSETLAHVILQALNNLEIQRDFINKKDLCQRLAAVKASNPDERALIEAIGQFLPTMLGDVAVTNADFEAKLEEFPSRDSGRIKELYYTLIDRHRPRVRRAQDIANGHASPAESA